MIFHMTAESDMDVSARSAEERTSLCSLFVMLVSFDVSHCYMQARIQLFLVFNSIYRCA